MKRIINCCTSASVVVLVMLTLFPVMGWSKPNIYLTPTESEKCCVIQDVALKRFDDIDQDSFVSLMGRRSAPRPNRLIDRILAGLLEQTSENVQKGFSLSQERLRPSQRIEWNPSVGK